MGVSDKDWKIWRIFNEPLIQKIRFEETQRNYIGEIKPTVINTVISSKKSANLIVEPPGPEIMHGFGVFVFKKRRHRYEGEFVEDNFNGYGIYVW